MALSQDQALALIRKQIGDGSQLDFARKHGLSPSFVSDVLTGRRDPSKAILDAVGLERVVTYRRKEKADA